MAEKKRQSINPAYGIRICAGCGRAFGAYRRDQKVHAHSDVDYRDCAARAAKKRYTPAERIIGRICARPGCNTAYNPTRSDMIYCSALCRDANDAEQYLQLTIKIPRNLLTLDTISGIIVLTIERGKVTNLSEGKLPI